MGRRNYQLPTSLWGTLKKAQIRKKGAVRDVQWIKVLELNMDHIKFVELLHIGVALWLRCFLTDGGELFEVQAGTGLAQ